MCSSYFHRKPLTPTYEVQSKVIKREIEGLERDRQTEGGREVEK